MLIARSGLTACDSCIVRGTRVRAPSGSRAAEGLVAGDEVLAFDVVRFVSVPRRLTAVARSASREIFEIRVGGSVVRATAQHPFWVTEKRAWVRADALVAGDVLVLLEGDDPLPASIESITTVTREEPTDVFDLTVDGPEHTFFADGILVHNKEPLPQCPVDPVTFHCAPDASGVDGDASEPADAEAED